MPTQILRNGAIFKMSDLPIYEKLKQFMRKGYLHYPFGLLAVLLSWGHISFTSGLRCCFGRAMVKE